MDAFYGLILSLLDVYLSHETKHLSIYCTDLRKSKCSIRFIKFILSLTHFPENTLIHIDENASQTKEDKNNEQKFDGKVRNNGWLAG